MRLSEDKLVNTGEKPILVRIDVECANPVGLNIIAYNSDKPNTEYTNRNYVMESARQTFFIRMPQSPKKTSLKITPKVKNALHFRDTKLKVYEPILSDLYSQVKEKKWRNQQVSDFLKFAKYFCENAGILSANNSTYVSDCWKYRIDYLDAIRDINGKKLATPARISGDTGTIELCKPRFIKYTVPMRMIILLHEFSHFFLNKDISNELEADENAMLIYLGCCYPTIDGLLGFNEIFQTSPSNLNYKRWQKLKEFAELYEKKPFYINFN